MAATKTKTKKQPPRHLKAKHQYKEAWLNEAMAYVRELFAEAGYPVPEHVRVSTGWPSKNAQGKKRRIGEAWHHKCSGDGVHEVIISLYLDDPVKVLGVLIHEVVHVTVGVEHGHKKPFADCAKAVGLVKPWTATGESEWLTEKLEQWAKELGQYPHAKLDGGPQQTKQSTRLLKLQCRECDCVIRVSNKWVEEYGAFDCPCGGVLAPSD